MPAASMKQSVRVIIQWQWRFLGAHSLSLGAHSLSLCPPSDIVRWEFLPNTLKAWKENTRIAKTLKHVAEDDGLFWMPYEDFLIHYRSMDLVDRTTGFRDLSLECGILCTMDSVTNRGSPL
jgi:hypothetical protein